MRQVALLEFVFSPQAGVWKRTSPNKGPAITQSIGLPASKSSPGSTPQGRNTAFIHIQRPKQSDPTPGPTLSPNRSR
ncbi:hypothetical protein BDW66DRAFT_136747 [Aspergillus desertorum]